MNKTLISLAAIAACATAINAQAQSSVKVYGVLDVSVGSFQEAGGTATTSEQSGKMTTSYWGFSSTEDLGNGLKAGAVVEGFLRMTNGASGRTDADPLFARNAFVNLAGGFGKLDAGRVTTSLFVNTLSYSAFGDSFGFSPSVRQFFLNPGRKFIGGINNTSWTDSVRYSTPNIGGFSATAHTAIKGSDPGTNTGLSASYSSGPFRGGLAWQSVKKDVVQTTAWNLGGLYDFGVLNLTAQYGKVTFDSAADTANDYTVSGVGVAIPMGGGRVLAQWGKSDYDKLKTSSTMTTVGYDYNVSKRTDVYVVFMDQKYTDKSSGTTYAVGIRHAF